GSSRDRNSRLSEGEDRRAGRRLSRREGCRSLPLARGHGLDRYESVGRGGEQADVRISRSDSVPEGDPRSYDEAVELRTLHGAPTGGWTIFLSAQQWSADPERAARR